MFAQSDPVRKHRELNAALFDLLESTNPMEKQAAVDELNNFIRVQVREDGIHRRYQPFPKVSSEDLTPQLTETNAIVCFKEPRSPAAVSIPYNTDPIGWFITGPRFLLTFQRIATPAFMKDISLLRTYPYDIRQVISDNSLRDLLAVEDSRFFAAIHSFLGEPNAPSPATGEVQYITVSGGVTRDSLKIALQLLPSLSGHFETQTIIVNNVTHKEILAWTHNEYGGPNSQEMLETGTIKDNLFGRNWIVTIKRHLVPDNTMYLLADPRAVSVAAVLQDTTMYVKTEAWKVMWFVWEEIGSVVANASGVGRVDFT